MHPVGAIAEIVIAAAVTSLQPEEVEVDLEIRFGEAST